MGAGETLAWIDAYLQGKAELSSEEIKVVRDTISAWFRDRDWRRGLVKPR